MSFDLMGSDSTSQAQHQNVHQDYDVRDTTHYASLPLHPPLTPPLPPLAPPPPPPPLPPVSRGSLHSTSARAARSSFNFWPVGVVTSRPALRQGHQGHVYTSFPPQATPYRHPTYAAYAYRSVFPPFAAGDASSYSVPADPSAGGYRYEESLYDVRQAQTNQMMFGSPEVNPPPPFRSFSSSGQIPSTKSCYFGENYCVGAPCDFPPTHAHSEGDCVSDNVSVVTLRAPDSSVFMTNGTHVTSQSESEFSLQDVKMSFDAKRNVPEPTSKPPPSPAAFCTVADTPTGHANIAHPGLDMLSDVSLFVEAYMTSPTGRIRTEAKPFQKTFSRYSDIPEVPNVEVEALDRHASLDMPAPPSATYIGVMKHEADSTGNFRRRDPRTSETDTAYSSSASIGHSSQDSEGSENASAANTIAAYYDQQATGGRPQGRTMSSSTTTNKRPSTAISTSSRTDKEQLCLPPKKARQRSTATISRGQSRHQSTAENSSILLQLLRAATDSNRAEKPPKKRGRPRKDQAGRNGIAFSPCHQIRPTQKIGKTKTKASLTKSLLSAARGRRQLPEINHHGPSTSSSGEPICDVSAGVIGSPAYCITSSDGDMYIKNGVGQENISVVVSDKNSSPDFDPLIIVEEEVTSSSEPVDVSTLPQENDAVGVDNVTKSSEKRKSSHCCESCLCYPSTSSDSSPEPSATTSPSYSPSSLPTFSPRKKRKSKGKKPGGRASKRQPRKQRRSKDLSFIPCEFCDKKFSTVSNMCRHKRTFHPDLYTSRRKSSTVLTITKSSPQAGESQERPATLQELDAVDPQQLMVSARSETDLRVNEFECSTTLMNLARYGAGVQENESAADLNDDITVSLRPTWTTEIFNAETQTKEKIEVGLNLPEEKTFLDLSSPRKRNTKKDSATTTESSPYSTAKQPSRYKNLPRKHLSRNLRSGKNATGITRKKYTRKTKRRPTSSSSFSSTVSSRSPRRLNFRTKQRTRINSTIPCPYCPKHFSVMSNLKRHTRQRHQDVFVFVCNVCDAKLSMRRTLRAHMKHHLDTHPHLCFDCLSAFAEKHELRAHSKHHVIDKFPCEECVLVFYTRAHLEEHFALHHEVVDEKDSF